jgi:acyl-CoA dehydrogenase
MTLGLGRAALESTVEYIKNRRAGGKYIIQHQGAGLIIANAAMNLEAARNMIWKAAWAKDNGEEMLSSGVDEMPYEHMAGAFTGEVVHRVCIDCMELFGGMGVIQGMEIEKYVRDSLVQKHISFPFPARFKIAEHVAGFERKRRPLLGNGSN